tara:strand:- start:1281 stop:2060 length:780 start_codon:yes stop_codon:yes gene_type:complete
MAELFKYGSAGVDNYANQKKLYLEFFHVPSGRTVAFKAFLEAYQDSFEQSWNSVDAFGRMDNIELFQRTQRKIAVTWKTVSYSLEESIDNMRRAQTFIKMLYPSYAPVDGKDKFSASAIAAAPLLKFRFVNLASDMEAGNTVVAKKLRGGTRLNSKHGTAADSGLLGHVGGVSYEPDIEEGFYDPKSAMLFPKTVTFTIDYTVIHTHALGWNTSGGERTKQFKNFPFGLEADKLVGKEKVISPKSSKTKQRKALQRKKK